MCRLKAGVNAEKMFIVRWSQAEGVGVGASIVLYLCRVHCKTNEKRFVTAMTPKNHTRGVEFNFSSGYMQNSL